MPTNFSITESFGENLAVILADKICMVYNEFNKKDFVNAIKIKKIGTSYTQFEQLNKLTGPTIF